MFTITDLTQECIKKYNYFEPASFLDHLRLNSIIKVRTGMPQRTSTIINAEVVSHIQTIRRRLT